MTSGPVSQRLAGLMSTIAPFLRFNEEYSRLRRSRPGDACDFTLGNPHDMPLAGFVSALQTSVVPQDKDWFAYKMSEPTPQAVIAATLRQTRGLTFEEQDIHLTNGAFAALSVFLEAILDPGDEVIFISPPWFFYEFLIAARGGVPVRVKVDPATFDLDLAAIEAAITPRTRGIIVNSPHNPTGKVYPPETLRGLADRLTRASERAGRPVYLLSDEAYSRIIFDGRNYPSPTAFYPYTALLYTYGKTLLTPGQRLGYIALPPSMPDRPALGGVITLAQVANGYAFPNALLQHALPDIEPLSIDIAHLQRKRDRLVGALRAIGYQTHTPEGTFYLLPRAPIADDVAFTRQLAERDIYVLPGAVVELPGYFRLSLTANDDMIERALPGFAQAFEAAA